MESEQSAQKHTEENIVRSFIEFVDKAGSPYHAVAEVKKLLQTSGFKEIDYTEKFNIIKGGKYFMVNNGSTIASIIIGGKFDPYSSSFVIVASHTDSPCLKLRPNADGMPVQKSGAYHSLSVETYGGGLWHTWFDRPLGLAGKVMTLTRDSEARSSNIQTHLIHISKPLMTIPSLAIHLKTAEERSSFTFSTEKHLSPVSCNITETHAGTNFKSFLANEVSTQKVSEIDIISHDLFLMDITPSMIVGTNEEFILASRIDNLASVFTTSYAISHVNHESIDKNSNILVCISYDHEEVGSKTSRGASSYFLQGLLRSVVSSLSKGNTEHVYNGMIARGILISVDGAHGLHPNYPDKAQEEHRPLLNKGIVIKENANQRYASEVSTIAIIKGIALMADCPLQFFTVPNDMPCGSTIGPIIASCLGIRTVDIGIPQLGMHSIKELAGKLDLWYLYRLTSALYSFNVLQKNSFEKVQFSRPSKQTEAFSQENF